MAVLMPALSTCVARMASGERRLAERLQQKLDDDNRLRFDVPVGPKQCHPDFVVLHPRRGLLILTNREDLLIAADGIPKSVPIPIEHARRQTLQVVDALKRDAQLIQHEGKRHGMPTMRLLLVGATRVTSRLMVANAVTA